MKVITDENKIDEILSRGVIVNVLPDKNDFKKLLMSGKRIKLYMGFDATGDTLHLSHAKNIMLLEDFRKLGHEVVFLFGDFTARIGDPSDQEGTRQMLTKKEVKKNIKSWKKQIKNIINFETFDNPAKIKFNGKWLSKLSFEDVIKLASRVTLQQMIERDMFQKRIKEGKHIFFHEFMYPLMQGYDSVAMEVDAEMCGTDQIFNALMGRTLLRKIKDKEKFVVVVGLMENPKTGEMMSKSRGTGVFLNTNPAEMYGAIMAQPDEMIEVLLVNCTRINKEEIKNIMQLTPMEAKKKTSEEIVKIIFSEKEAKKAAEIFNKTFQKKEIPDEIEEIKGEGDLGVLCVTNKIVDSMSQWRRLVDEGAIKKIDNEKEDKIVEYKKNAEKGIYKIGKRKFIKII